MNGSCTVTDFDTLSTELSQFWRCMSRRGTDTIIDTRTNTLPFPGSQGTLFIYFLIHSFIYEALCQASQLPMLLHIIEHTFQRASFTFHVSYIFTVHSAMVYVIQICRQFSSRSICSCSKAVWHTITECIVNKLLMMDSEQSETCRVSYQNKFVKVVHLVAFYYKEIYDTCSGFEDSCGVLGFPRQSTSQRVIHTISFLPLSVYLLPVNENPSLLLI